MGLTTELGSLCSWFEVRPASRSRCNPPLHIFVKLHEAAVDSSSLKGGRQKFVDDFLTFSEKAGL